MHSGDTLQPCRTGCDSEEESDFEEEDNFEEESDFEEEGNFEEGGDFEGIGGIGFRSGGRPNGRRRPAPLPHRIAHADTGVSSNALPALEETPQTL